MSEFVAYPDWIKNNTALEAYYNGVQFRCRCVLNFLNLIYIFDLISQVTVSTTTYFQNVQDTNAFLNKEDFKTLRGTTDRNRLKNMISLIILHSKTNLGLFNRWNTYPTIVNAFYEPGIYHAIKLV